MTICNMSIECGRAGGHDRAGRDDVRLPARAGRTRRPGADWDAAVAYWQTLQSDRRRDRSTPR